MRRDTPAARLTRILLVALVVLVVAYLALLAAWPDLGRHVPGPLRSFGAQPPSWPTIAITVALIALAFASSYRARRGRRSPGVPIALVVALVAITLVLGFSSYVNCARKDTSFFAPITWAAAMLAGEVNERGCLGLPVPVALEVARLTALAALFVSVVAAVVAILQARLDRVRVAFARSVTVVVGIDDDAQSMVSALLKTLGHRDQLALITSSPDRTCVHESRNAGARVVAADFNRPETFDSLRLWRKLERLYLLSPDPTTNLLRLGAINNHVTAIRDKKRIPLIVRIDDPWQAEAWRAQQFGGSDTRWAADAVGKYEVTAQRLLHQILSARVARILVCGTSRLTLALCADMAQRQLERRYYADPTQPPIPSLTIVGRRAEEYLQDHEFRQSQTGAPSDLQVDVVGESASVPLLSGLITDGPDTAVIFVDADATAEEDTAASTRLAARFPSTPVYAWDPQAQVTDDRIPLVGQLRTFRLAMDLPPGQARDAWERAAMLIHQRYAAERGRDSLATRPWAQLDEFYRGSNRRQVRNALRLVEEIGGHTWNTWGGGEDPVKTSALRGLKPLEQLRLMGFDRATSMKMAEAEFESWREYYERGGWKYGPVRDDERKIHDKLVDWPTTVTNPELLDAALISLATTLMKLRELGYQSRPLWDSYRRTGVVAAGQRDSAWTWLSRSGQTMHARAGDWEVRDLDGESWSVRDDIFRATYEHVDENLWRRTGLVEARPAREGETVETLEGPVTAGDGHWIVKGERGELWTMPGNEFARRYERPVNTN